MNHARQSSIPPLCSSILYVLQPHPPLSLQAELIPPVSLTLHSPVWMKSHFLPLKPSRSHFYSVTSDPHLWKPLGELQKVHSLLALHDTYPIPFFHDIFHEINQISVDLLFYTFLNLILLIKNHFYYIK